MKYLILAALALASPLAAAENRCGWVDNPTPGNWWLTDRVGEWTLGMQGGYQARGLDEMPDMSAKHWVKTNGYYGYGCACLKVDVDAREKRVTRIYAATPKPVALCRADKALPRRRG